jgi:MFS family permease
LFGAVGLAAAIISFGLSHHFWQLVLSRCAQGIFNGNIGVTKA